MFRYVVLALGLLCLTALGCNYTIINFTFICMTNDSADVIDIGNGTYRQRYDYTPTEKSSIIWAVAAGTIIGTFPVNWAYVRWGARYPFFLSGTLSAFSTALSPLAAHYSLWMFVGLRFLQGIAYAADFAALGIIVVRWSPLTQTAIFISILTCFSSLASIITNPMAGIFCTSIGWRWSFYFHAVLTLIVFTLWLFLYRDDPQKHKMVSRRELEAIQAGKTRQHIDRESFVPYMAICKDAAVIVVWLNALTEIMGYIIMITYAPIYINKVLGYSITHTSFLASIGCALHTVFKLMGGFLSDKMSFLSERTKMMMFNTFSVGLGGFLCGLIGFMPSPQSALACLVAATTVTGMNTAGFYKCATLHSRQYAHFVLATIQFSKCAALVIGPLMVALFAESDEDAVGWKMIFVLNAAFMLLANILFFFTATDQPAEFTKMTSDTCRSEKELIKLNQ